MKLFEVTNGWCGESYVYVLVIASSEAEAMELASEKLHKDAFYDWGDKRQRYNDSYWKDLKATVLCEDVSVPWAGNVSGG